jgi:hypothetical protein
MSIPGCPAMGNFPRRPGMSRHAIPLGQRRRAGVFAAGFIRGAARITHESCWQATAIGSRLKKDSPAPCQIRTVQSGGVQYRSGSGPENDLAGRVFVTVDF